MHEKIKYIDTKNFEAEVLQGDKVVVDFYSTECPPCEALAAKYEGLSEIYGSEIKFVKIFRQENRELAESLDVKSSPTVLFYDHGSRVGDFLSGGIKRSDLRRNLDALLPPGRAAALAEGIAPVSTKCDLLVLGGGPAGLTAAIYAAQARLNVILVDTALTGGQVTTTHQVSNYPGFAEPQPGYMLMHYMQAQAKTAGAVFREAVDITDIDLKSRKVIIDGQETIHAKKLIIASGASPRELGVTGELELKGRGVSYCATCDAKYYGDKEVVVIGGGNSAIEEALFITRFASRVTVVHQFAKLQANSTAQAKAFANSKIGFIFEHEPRIFRRNDKGRMEVVIEELKSGQLKTLTTDGVFVFAGMKPNLSGFEGAFTYDDWGYIWVDATMHTNIKDVFAVGDVASKPFRQITVAVADGTIAAIQAAKELELAD